MSVEQPNLLIRLSHEPLKETQNGIIGLICPFLPPHNLDKCPPIRKMDDRGGGDRKDKLLNKAFTLYALQLRLLSNWNKWNKVQYQLRSEARKGLFYR